ncbi:hypothetical protein SAMN05660662_0683 [Blastococcus aurantiacus]|uniref:NADPH2:quinone reductase n=1 Tax=Blastococcus aurantiacus TaxID=1550231 RepID=A0A1G7HKU3_9ACTN|nr:Zn-dependent oxidoreductase [Blastococcus aurantiacus]SDF01065.1 hypothetical protein SAMN05660662_0683 [Blastococcus aurantiacus]
MRAVQITKLGGPEVLDVVDVPEPEAGPGQQLYDVSTAGINFADTHHRLSRHGRHPHVQEMSMGVAAGFA